VILDSSAIIAIVLREPGWESLAAKLGTGPAAGVGAPTLVETGLVLTTKMGTQGRAMVSRFLHQSGVTVVPFGEDHWRVAVEAHTRFGKGRHAASLNFGDCLSYAVARLARQPLLFVGEDFKKTDLDIA
jgi:ribonuclease VapC